jgi:hypothetical protein
MFSIEEDAENVKRFLLRLLPANWSPIKFQMRRPRQRIHEIPNGTGECSADLAALSAFPKGHAFNANTGTRGDTQ